MQQEASSAVGAGAPKTARESRGTASRRTILQAAIRVVGREGLPAASLGVIAREAGTSKPAVLYHFGSRENLLREMARTGLDRFYKGTYESALALEKGEQARVILNTIFAKENRIFFAAVRELMTLGIRDPVIGEQVRRVFDGMARGTALLLPHRSEAGVRVAAQIVWCVFGFIEAWLCTGEEDPSRFREACIEVATLLAAQSSGAG